MARALAASIALLLAAALTVPAWSKSREAVPDSFTIAAGGDLIGPYKSIAGLDAPGLRQVAALFQHADVGFAPRRTAS